MASFVGYYWTLAKHLGFRVWETRGRELVSALVLATVTFFVGWMFRQVDSATAFEIAVLALVGWLCVFAFGHVIHAPVLLREGHHHDKARSQHWGFGILGVVILVVIASTITAIAMWLWVDRTPALAIPSAAPAMQVTIEAQKREIASLKARIPDDKSLKLRLLALADEYEQFWKRQPKMPMCKTTAGMTQQQIQDAMKPCTDYSFKQMTQYQQIMAPRIMSGVEEFKGKGGNVNNIENCAAMGYCGISMSIQLRAFSEQLDAHDNLKGSGCSSGD